MTDSDTNVERLYAVGDEDATEEILTDPELARLEREFNESSERLYHLNAIIAHARALERLYDDDALAERQIVQETRLNAKQLRG
jgi:hypothetical protein